MFSGYFWVVELQIIFMILLPCILHFLNVLTKKKKKKFITMITRKAKNAYFMKYCYGIGSLISCLSQITYLHFLRKLPFIRTEGFHE